MLDGNTIVDGTFTVTDTIFAPNMNISKFTVGTLNAANVNIINLNADNIATGILRAIDIEGVTIRGSTFIQESSQSGSTFARWDGQGITMRDPDGLLIMDMNRQGLNFHGSGVSHKGTYINNDLIDTQNLNVYNLNVTGGDAKLLSATFNGNITLNSPSGDNGGIIFNGASVPVASNRMIWAGNGNRGNGLYTYFNGWRMLQNELTSDSNVTVNQLTVSNIVDSSSLQLQNRLRLQNAGLQFTGESLPGVVDRQMWIGYGYADTGIYVSLNGNWHKHGATISDERLKKNIVETATDSLTAIKSWEFVEFEWRYSGYGSGQQFGLIAQNTSHIANYYDEVDRWEIDTQKQTMMNSHAIQQLALKEQNTNKMASQALQLGESNESKIHKLQQELSKANRRIEELESVM